MSDLYSLWENYTAASTRSAANDFGLAPPPNPVNIGIDSARFLKLCKDGKLMSRNLRYHDIDLIFAKYNKQRRLDFYAFQDCLVEISLRKGEGSLSTLPLFSAQVKNKLVLGLVIPTYATLLSSSISNTLVVNE